VQLKPKVYGHVTENCFVTRPYIFGFHCNSNSDRQNSPVLSMCPQPHNASDHCCRHQFQ